ncbi:MAG TPA: ferritin-like domain-containing protein [Gemmatimonadota bacterium]|nr:ferritin-like domain-containing protein [Gemmatimonadota bacterium]
MKENTFHDLFVDQLRDLYDAEQQITQALPGVIEAVSTEELRKALEHHLELTHGHVERLDRIFSDLGEPAAGKSCKGMEGLVKEGEEAIENHPGGALRDALIIAGAQRIEHYEISGYGTAKAWAEELDLEDVVDLLDDTLDEEAEADEKLSAIATGGLLTEGINQTAAAR